MATKTSHLVRPLVALVALVAAMAALLVAYSASPAHAALDSCTTIGDTTTCTYVPSGSEDTFVVPDGVSSVSVVATGAPGAVGGALGGDASGPAGRGATVSGDLTVTPGQKLYVNVGGAPTGDPTGSICRANVACVGGFNGGGSSSSASSGFGGGGGGASDVRTVATPSTGDQGESLNSRLIVAGGGGGSGGWRGCGIDGPILPGGAGGDAGSDGGDGTPCPPDAAGTGGDAGSQSAGGSGGSPDGHSGSLGLGGNGGGSFGGSGFGGGGGGGYYGGGGGGSINGDSPAGGGGGGSNLVPTGGTAAVIADSGPSITISYSVPDNTAPSITAPPNITVEATGPDGAAVEFGTDEANGCSATDNADPQPVISYDPQSGSTFPIGTTPVTCTATDSSGNFATATFSVTVEDTAAPKVISTSPRDGGEVGPAANIRATFSEDMQSASVVNAFKLFKKGSTNRIAAQVTYDAETDTATLNPTNNLKRGATYKAVVSTVAKDEAGNRLDQDESRDGVQQKVWFFEIDN